MKEATRYAASAVAVVAFAILALWPFLDPPARSGVIVAGLVALPVQVVGFGLLVRFRGKLNGFLAVWAGGTLVRMAAVAVVAVVAVRSGSDGAVPMLLALAGFFFGLLLLEPVHFRREAVRPTEVR